MAAGLCRGTAKHAQARSAPALPKRGSWSRGPPLWVGLIHNLQMDTRELPLDGFSVGVGRSYVRATPFPKGDAKVNVAALALCLLGGCQAGSASAAESYDWSVWATVSTNRARHIRLNTLSTSKPLVRYRLAVGPSGGASPPVELLVEVNCELRTRRVEFAVRERIPQGATFESVEGLGPEYLEEMDYACRWAQMHWTIASSTPGLPSLKQGEPKVFTGSGFVVSAYHVVTNQHVVETCRRISVRRDGRSSAAQLIASTVRNDLALLRTEEPVGVATAVRTSAVLGEDVTVAGHPLPGMLSDDIIVTGGQVNALAGLGNDPAMLQISSPVQFGNSGGPLIDRSGSVVGVVVSKLNVDRASKATGDFAQNVNFAIKPEVLRLFLDTNRVQYRTAPLGPRLDGIQLAERARQFTVQVICEK